MASLLPDANRNCVHCINAHHEEFRSMFCKLLLYRIKFSVMLHAAAPCVCFPWKKLLETHSQLARKDEVRIHTRLCARGNKLDKSIDFVIGVVSGKEPHSSFLVRK